MASARDFVMTANLKFLAPTLHMAANLMIAIDIQICVGQRQQSRVPLRENSGYILRRRKVLTSCLNTLAWAFSSWLVAALSSAVEELVCTTLAICPI